MYSCILKWTFSLRLSFYWFPSPAESCLSQHAVIGLWRSRSGWCHLKPKWLCNNVSVSGLPAQEQRCPLLHSLYCICIDWEHLANRFL